jgi:hypothetical protein
VLTAVGGVLGIFCSHAYAHSSSSVQSRLPLVLKGSDMVLYSIFDTLGFPVKILPVLGMEGEYVLKNLEVGGESEERDSMVEDYWEEDFPRFLRFFGMDYEKMVAEEAGNFNYDDIDNRWKVLLCGRRVKVIENMLGTAGEKGGTEVVDNFRRMARVGKKLYEYFVTDRGQEEDMEEV